MTETETLLIAWRDARKAIFAHQTGKDTPKLFDKLATAERAPRIEIIRPGPYVDPHQTGAEPESP